jgi:hypothetical protein
MPEENAGQLLASYGDVTEKDLWPTLAPHFGSYAPSGRYTCCHSGIRAAGAIPHLAGMKGSRAIVAINKAK